METAVLMDELRDIEADSKSKEPHFYKGYLTNVVKRSPTDYLVQIAYLGLRGQMPVQRATFELVAHQDGDRFVFAAPLKRNTASWKTTKTGNCTFHYKQQLNLPVATAYEKTIAAFDRRLNNPGQQTEVYCCEDLPEVMHVTGVVYKSDYNGYTSNIFSARDGKKKISVNGVAGNDFSKFDPHDLWHDRLRNVLPAASINKPVDEGCAYLYGGSWGMSWAEILSLFKEKVSNNPASDWLSLYESFHNFGPSQDKQLMVAYVINALIVKQLEREKGFPPVMELLGCGKYEKGNDNYFKTLERLTGINRTNFNDRVWALVRKEK